MQQKIKPVWIYAAWGALFGVLANLLQAPIRGDAFDLGRMLGGALGGAFFGSIVWWWRNRFS